jgi:hypothetical protein
VLLACAISVAGTLLKIENAAAQEQTIDCDDVPIAVRTAFQKAYPKATTQGCAQEVEVDKTAYEILSTEGKTKRDVLYYADGTLIVVEEAIDAADLPSAVQQALGEVLEDHKIELVEKLSRDNVVTYEIKSKHADVAMEIVFDGSGKVLKIAGAGAESAPSGIEGEEKSEKTPELSGEEEEEEEEEGGKN